MARTSPSSSTRASGRSPRCPASVPAGPAPKPDTVVIAPKLELSSTVTSVPSDFFMWTSYGEALAELVSARMTVAPGTAAVAAAVAFWRSVPVNSVSLGPWVMVAGSPAAPAGGVLADPPEGATVLAAPDEGLVAELVAADATPAAPRPAPATMAPVTSARRSILGFGDMMDSSFQLLQGFPGAVPPSPVNMRPGCLSTANILRAPLRR